MFAINNGHQTDRPLNVGARILFLHSVDFPTFSPSRPVLGQMELGWRLGVQ